MTTFSTRNLAWYLIIMLLGMSYMVFFDIIVNLYDLKMLIITFTLQLFVCYTHSLFMNLINTLTERRISFVIGVCMWILGTLAIIVMYEHDFSFGLVHPILNSMMIIMIQIAMIWIILGYTMILENEKADYELVIDFFPVIYLCSVVLAFLFYCAVKPLILACFAFIGHLIVVIVFVMAFIYHCIEMLSECCGNRKNNSTHDVEDGLYHIDVHFPN